MTMISKLQWRYAVKQFDTHKKLTDDQFSTLLEALRLAPSSFGLQPWKFVVVRNPEVRAQLKVHSWNQGQVVEASHLVVLCALREINEAHVDSFIKETSKVRGVSSESLADYSGVMKGFLKKQNPDQLQHWMRDQVYIALGTLLTVCAVEGVDACPMEGFDSKAYDQILGLESKGLKSIVVVPVGYRAATDKYANAKKIRFPLGDLVVEMA